MYLPVVIVVLLLFVVGFNFVDDFVFGFIEIGFVNVVDFVVLVLLKML